MATPHMLVIHMHEITPEQHRAISQALGCPRLATQQQVRDYVFAQTALHLRGLTLPLERSAPPTQPTIHGQFLEA